MPKYPDVLRKPGPLPCCRGLDPTRQNRTEGEHRTKSGGGENRFSRRESRIHLPRVSFRRYSATGTSHRAPLAAEAVDSGEGAKGNGTMGFSLVEGFYKSLAMTVLSEIGDKTFFAAAILAMRHPRRLVLAGCLGALIVMTMLSAFMGWAAPNMISRQWTHIITTVLFFSFGLWSLREGFTHEGNTEELAEVEAKLNADFMSATAGVKTDSKEDDLKKKQRPFLTQLLSPIFLKAFSITFFGEWGDKSQIATIGLAADENPFGVVLGGVIGQALCTTAAVIGGKSVASQISEKMVALSSGILFVVFGIQSLLSSVQ